MPRRQLGPVALAMMAILLAGCAVSNRNAATLPETAAQPSAGPKPLFPLAPPQGPARRIVQQLTAAWPGRSESFLCVLELDSRRIAMAGLTPAGMSLFNLTYDGRTLQADKNPLVPENLAPALIVADLQLAYWPLALLKTRLPKSLQLETGPDFRRLVENGNPLVDVRYLHGEAGGPAAAWPKDVELVHHRYHYQLRIQTVSDEIVSE